MQVATFANKLRNNRRGTTTKPFLATVTPGKTGWGRVTKVGPNYYEGIKYRESHCKHVTRIKNVSDLDPVEHPEILIHITSWKTVENTNVVPHTCTTVDGMNVEASNRFRHEIRKCVAAGQRNYDEMRALTQVEVLYNE